MVNESIIAKLKISNISADSEKTKERASELWRSASKEQKLEIERLADVKRITMQRIYKLGRISAKLVVPIAQVLNVDPFYLIGETDERGECTDRLIAEFLTRFGYEKLLPEKKRTRGRRRKTQEAEVIESGVQEAVKDDEAEETAAFEAPKVQAEADSPKETDKIDICPIDEMSEEEMTALLHSELIRAKYGADGAAKRIRKMKALLLARE